MVNASLAGSHGDAGTGRLIAYGFDRQGSDFSFSLRSQLADPDFSQIGLQPGLPPRRRQDVVSLGMPFGRFGSVALSRVAQKSADQPDTEVIDPRLHLAARPLCAVGYYGDCESSATPPAIRCSRR